MRSTLALLPVVLTVAWAMPAQAQITGPARVITSDRIMVGDQRVILWGMDSVEPDQDCRLAGAPWNCSDVAKRQLEIILDLGPVVCEPVQPALFAYVAARCRAGDVDVAERMVRQGWAFAFERHGTDYVEAEAAARAEGLGFWQPGVEVEDPEAWRLSQSRPTNEP